MKIAVIGSGISGLAAAWLLAPLAEVHVFEMNDRPGGHAHTAQATVDGQSIAVDVGFSVYHEKTYPHLTELFKYLAIPTSPSSVSFSVRDGTTGLEYAADSLGSLFAQRWRLLDFQHWGLVADILKFNRLSHRFMALGSISNSLTLGEYLRQIRMGQGFSQRYLLPIASSLWSLPMADALALPAVSFIRYLSSHGLLALGQEEPWRSVDGGSQTYVKKMLDGLGDRLHLGEAVTNVRRLDSEEDLPQVEVITALGRTEHFHHVIFACHANQVLGLLAHASAEEYALLSCFRYQSNRAVLHTDPSLMPKLSSCWASMNILTSEEEARKPGQKLCVSYWINRLQNIQTHRDVFLTLNPAHEPERDHVLGEYHYNHPLFTLETAKAQSKMKAIQGRDGIWYAGSYMRNGFHEDGLVSGIQVAKALGAILPW